MANVVIVGAQWGDEGKGKIVDLLAERVDVVARYQGGHNAGHTVNIAGRQFILHLIPTGILHPDKICLIGNGLVVDPKALLEEIQELQRQGIDCQGRLFVSHRAHLIMPYHRGADQQDSQAQGLRCIGTTGRGIGPAYADKMGRVGILAIDLLDEELFLEKLKNNLPADNPQLLEEHFREYIAYAAQIKPYLADTTGLIHQAIQQGKRILFEGAQGTMLDVDHGTYPYVTSSSATSGGACTGLGVGPTLIGGVLGVAKAYTTRVGHGPFPTEQDNACGEKLRAHGGEYGATTGRPRRCGWFDAVVVRHAVMVNGIQSLALTKLDVLDDYPALKVCVGYEWKGQRLNTFPAQLRAMQEVTPVYEELPGWQCNTQGITRYQDLPVNARRYVERLQELTGAEISIISTGPQRQQTILGPQTLLEKWFGPMG